MFKIYNASAGSGKTYTIVKDYLIIAGVLDLIFFGLSLWGGYLSCKAMVQPGVAGADAFALAGIDGGQGQGQ